MAWKYLSITEPHLVYILLGAFTSLFMLCSSFIKERLYIGEATVATIFGVIFGPHCANLINPIEWGNVDIVTMEFSRIVLVVQCFAIGVELPKYYMEKHWRSVVVLLLPVMTWGWIVTSLFVWWMVPTLNWLESLVVSACVTATDPVLASSVVGKGKFARRVPKHLRDLLSAESGCNDGMAFPFLYLAVWLILEHKESGPVTFHWFVLTILYGCVFGAFYGFMVGYISRRGIRLAEKYDLIDRESFLVFYFVLALFCAGSGSLLGLDDLLVGFAAGVGFSNDGWFSQKTEESSVSNVIDLLLNLSYFVYLGTVIPWQQFNDSAIGLSAWRLVVIAILVILFRRIPIMLMMKPFIPDIKTWREALFAGHFGPIGVGAIFVAMLARAEMEDGHTVPTSELPEPGTPNYELVILVWPIVTFLVVSSIVVHGSSIAVFTLGKRINTLTLTMSYTAAPEDGPAWMNRLPRILSQSKSQARTMDSESEGLDLPPGFPGTFIRHRKSEDRTQSRASSRNRSHASSLVARKRKTKKDPVGGPISQSAIYPQRPQPAVVPTDRPQDTPESTSSTDAANTNVGVNSNSLDPRPSYDRRPSSTPSARSSYHINVYDEGDNYIFETEDGEVVGVTPTHNDEDTGSIHGRRRNTDAPDLEKGDAVAPVLPQIPQEPLGWSFADIKKRVANVIQSESEKRKGKALQEKKSEPARAYQFGNTIIVEDEDGEVIKTYELPSENGAGKASGATDNLLKYIGLGKNSEQSGVVVQDEGSGSVPRKKTFAQAVPESDIDDRHIRFTIGGQGQRMTKDAFIQAMRSLDLSTRNNIVENSTASPRVKALVRNNADPNASLGGSQTAKRQLERAAEIHPTPQAHAVPPQTQAPPQTSMPSRSPAHRPPRRNSDSYDDDADEDMLNQQRASLALYDNLSVASDADSGEGEDSGDEDGDQETAAERRRRLAALGTIHDDDMNERVQSSHSNATNAAQAQSRPITPSGMMTPVGRVSTPVGQASTPTNRVSTPVAGTVTPAESASPLPEGVVEGEAPTRRGIRFAESARRG
ncbi:Na+/H+ antiporter [Ceratocystis pirilliformis]|uniref:Na+/H+ antiporter n=1 Tax=Ceratocystis pirilliformis TaxID=259994 RepID=A0ABR3YQU4_9PEZI